MDFHVGDKVIHSSYGMADIVDLESKEISGKTTRFYVVRAKDLLIWIPVVPGENGSLRLPASRSEFEGLFPILRAHSDPLSENRMERKSQIHARMKEGYSASLCRLVRDMSVYNRNKKLNEYEHSVFERATAFLVDEWQYSMSVTLAQARRELNQLLEESYTQSTA
jgi:RNA polymerase-interacting CarD/CdnL/TRCF family regulator